MWRAHGGRGGRGGGQLGVVLKQLARGGAGDTTRGEDGWVG